MTTPKFKLNPTPLHALPDPDALARFAAGADMRATDALPAATAPPPVREPRPVRKPDKDAKPTTGINLRLNEYEHELLTSLAKGDARSLQQTIKRLLVPAAESEAAARARRKG